MQERVATLGEVPAMVAFFFLDEVAMEPAAFDKVIGNDPLGQALLAAAIERFAEVHWDAAALHAATLELGEAMLLNLRKAQAPIRCAVTGSLVGPPLFESLEYLGRDKVIGALERGTRTMFSLIFGPLRLALKIVSDGSHSRRSVFRRAPSCRFG